MTMTKKIFFLFLIHALVVSGLAVVVPSQVAAEAPAFAFYLELPQPAQVCHTNSSCLSGVLAGEVDIPQAGNYSIQAVTNYDGDTQLNESYFLTIVDYDGNLRTALNPNLGEDFLVADPGGPAAVVTQPAGNFYLAAGINSIYMDHVSVILDDNEINQPVDLTEDVSISGIWIMLLSEIPDPQPVCGNNILEDGEQCDDGNLIDGDGCSSTCQIEEPEPGPPLICDGILLELPQPAQVCHTNSSCLLGVLAAEVDIPQAGDYSIQAVTNYDGDTQLNESYFLTIVDFDGNLRTALNPNLGEDFLVADPGGPAAVVTQPAGNFYLAAGINSIYMDHVSVILDDNELNQPVNLPEDVSISALCLTPLFEPCPEDNPLAQVSINFDDGLMSTYILAAQAMAGHGLVATAYVYTEAQNEKVPGLYYEEFMGWDEVVSLQNDFGWEVGAHSYSHPDLTSLTFKAAKNEIDRNRNDLMQHGIQVESFATPYGAYNEQIVNYLKQDFSSHRTAWNLPNTLPADAYQLKAVSVTPETSPEEIKAWLDEAKANNQWLIILFHDITSNTPEPGGYAYGFDNFTRVLNYINQSCLPVVTNSGGLNRWASLD